LKIHEYKGEDIVVLFDAGRCIHAKECVHGQPSVFNPDAKPWVNAGASSAGAIAAVIRRCPTGALHYQAGDPKLAEHPEPSNTVITSPDGPLYLRGNITVVTAGGGELLADSRVALCRCGASKNKPLCDKSHFAAAFNDPGMAAPGETAHREMATSGKLRVTPTTDGPLHLQGQITVRNAAGDVIFEGIETWLCRCGASSSKPFCDGSHKTAGFNAD
jgi:CDGSH-type Zn-finger protein/uncharacterized Fe-S cluster protein YjdI